MNITGSNITWPTTTRTLTDKTLSNTRDAVFDARSREHHIESRVEGTVEELIDIIENMLADQEHYCILNSPSKAAMEGATTLTGDTNRSIRPTRPSDELVREFGKAANLPGLEDLWYPSTLISWSFGIITRYMNRHSDGAVPPDVLLSVARFGEAQLCGASEDVMAVAFEDLKARRYRTHRQWRELVVGNRIVQENVEADFKGDMVLFTGPAPNGDECLIHELEMPFHAQMALQIAFEVLDEKKAWEMRKIHYQAFVKKVDVKDLEHDEKACAICLMEYENEKANNKERKRCIPLYDVMEDNRQPIELMCGHIFGATCIEKWLSDNDNCPICRATLIGRDRKLKPITQQMVSTITSYHEGEMLLYYEDMEFDRLLHGEITEAIQRRHISAFISLEFQFQCLEEIDLRLGTVKRNSRGNLKTDSPVARWMDEDWDRFATNSLRLREYVKEYIRSNSDRTPDPLTMEIKMVLAKMLNAHRQRSQL
jgi:hypothetical protein